MKYKVGDTVRVKSLNWFEHNCKKSSMDSSYHVEYYACSFTRDMQLKAGKTIVIKKVCDGFYLADDRNYNWYDWMFEDIEMEEVLVPFDVEKAKAGAEVVTRNGRAVRILCYDRKSGVYPIIALVNDGGKESNNSFTIDGFYHSNKSDCSEDLLIKEYRPKQRTEFTMQEIADRLGVDVDKLKIKK